MHLLDMVTLVFLGLGPLVCALVPVEMFQLCAVSPSMVEEILALVFTARKHHASIKLGGTDGWTLYTYVVLAGE
jgi:hypothetical protein